MWKGLTKADLHTCITMPILSHRCDVGLLLARGASQSYDARLQIRFPFPSALPRQPGQSRRPFAARVHLEALADRHDPLERDLELPASFRRAEKRAGRSGSDDTALKGVRDRSREQVTMRDGAGQTKGVLGEERDDVDGLVVPRRMGPRVDGRLGHFEDELGRLVGVCGDFRDLWVVGGVVLRRMRLWEEFEGLQGGCQWLSTERGRSSALRRSAERR